MFDRKLWLVAKFTYIIICHKYNDNNKYLMGPAFELFTM